MLGDRGIRQMSARASTASTFLIAHAKKGPEPGVHISRPKPVSLPYLLQKKRTIRLGRFVFPVQIVHCKYIML